MPYTRTSNANNNSHASRKEREAGIFAVIGCLRKSIIFAFVELAEEMASFQGLPKCFARTSGSNQECFLVYTKRCYECHSC